MCNLLKIEFALVVVGMGSRNVKYLLQLNYYVTYEIFPVFELSDVASIYLDFWWKLTCKRVKKENFSCTHQGYVTNYQLF